MSVLLSAKAPSLSAFFMAAALSALLLLVARIVFVLMRLWSCPVVPDAHDKDSSLFLSYISKPWARSFHLNSLPASLPFTLSISEKSPSEASSGAVMGLPSKTSQLLPVANWKLRTGPQFQPPPPALYESPVPLSMAKMIMSRHTFRRPNPSRFRRSSTASSSRPTSPPQTPSRLYHSIA